MANHDTDDTYLNEVEAAKVLGLSHRTLQKFRVIGGGPVFAKLGAKSVRYKHRALLEWAEAKSKRSTSDSAA